MLKFLIKFALCDKEARHITHCASAESEKSKPHSAAIIASFRIRSNFIRRLLLPAKEVCRKNQPRSGEMFIARARAHFVRLGIERNISISLNSEAR